MNVVQGITQAEADARYAPLGPDYLVKTANATLPAERVVTDNTEITWDWSVAGIVKAVIAAASIAYSKIQNVSATNRFLGRKTAGSGTIEELSANDASTILDGATDPFLRTSAASGGYTDEQAQDAVGGILGTGLAYDDGTPSITIDPDDASTVLDGASDPFVRTSAAGGGSGLTLIETKTVTSDVTDVTFSGLDGDTDGVYLLVFRLKAAASGAVVLQMNGATTNHSGAQAVIRADAASFYGGTGTWRFANPSNGDVYSGEVRISAKSSINGVGQRRQYWGQSGGHSGSYSQYYWYGGEWDDTSTNITSIVIHAEVASAIANGSQFSLFKYDY